MRGDLESPRDGPALPIYSYFCKMKKIVIVCVITFISLIGFAQKIELTKKNTTDIIQTNNNKRSHVRALHVHHVPLLDGLVQGTGAWPKYTGVFVSSFV